LELSKRLQTVVRSHNAFSASSFPPPNSSYLFDLHEELVDVPTSVTKSLSHSYQSVRKLPMVTLNCLERLKGVREPLMQQQTSLQAETIKGRAEELSDEDEEY